MGLYITLAVIGAILLILIVALVKTYNGLVVLKNRVENQGAQIEVQLKRRADLIPNLIETTKGYASYEKETLTQVTELRSKVLAATSPVESYQAGEALGKAVSGILAIGERYPELKADANFLRLQTELSDTEDKVVKARQFYNDTVTKYNTAIMLFPKSLVAGMFGFSKQPLLEATTEERKAVKIDGNTFDFSKPQA